MPCNCDHMEPSEHEKESKRVAQLLVYIHDHSCPEKLIRDDVKEAAEHYYGDASMVHHFTDLLCLACKNMPEEVKEKLMYDGRNPKARMLAEWWDAHQEADKQRLNQEAEKKRINDLKQSASEKLTDEEKKALGLA